MNVDRLRAIGPPPAPVLAPALDDLRRTFCPDYDRARAVELGERSAWHGTRVSTPIKLPSGRGAATEPFCGDCGAVRSPIACEPCKACGSTQPPNLSRMNPRARHIVGESPLR